MLSEIPADRYNSDFWLAFSARIHFSVNQCVLAPRNQAGPEGPKQLKVIIMHTSIRHWSKCSFGGRENSNRKGSKARCYIDLRMAVHTQVPWDILHQVPGLLGTSRGITSKQGQLTWKPCKAVAHGKQLFETSVLLHFQIRKGRRKRIPSSFSYTRVR